MKKKKILLIVALCFFAYWIIDGAIYFFRCLNIVQSCLTRDPSLWTDNSIPYYVIWGVISNLLQIAFSVVMIIMVSITLAKDGDSERELKHEIKKQKRIQELQDELNKLKDGE